MEKELINRIITENLIPYKCGLCENDGIWLGQKISLILSPINGNKSDIRLENLRFLCPNCNSIPTDKPVINKGVQLEERNKTMIKVKKNLISRKPTEDSEYSGKLDDLLKEIDEFGYEETARLHNVSELSLKKWIKWANTR